MFGLNHGPLWSPEGGTDGSTGQPTQDQDAAGSVNLDSLVEKLGPAINKIVNVAVTNHLKRQKSPSVDDIAKIIEDKISGVVSPVKGVASSKDGTDDGSDNTVSTRIKELETSLMNERNERKREREQRLSVERRDAIRSKLSKFDLHNEDQVVRLLESDIKVTENGELYVDGTDDIGSPIKLPMEAYVGKFMESNPHLIKQKSAGSGAVGGDSGIFGGGRGDLTPEKMATMGDAEFRALESKLFGSNRFPTGDPFGTPLTAEELNIKQ